MVRPPPEPDKAVPAHTENCWAWDRLVAATGRAMIKLAYSPSLENASDADHRPSHYNS